MAQITGTITFKETGFVYPEHLQLSLCYYDYLSGIKKENEEEKIGILKYAKIESAKVYQDFTYEINFNTKDLLSNTTHFIELKYADLSIRTSPENVNDLLVPVYDIEFFELTFHILLSGIVKLPKGAIAKETSINIIQHALTGTTELGQTMTNADGVFYFEFKALTSVLLKVIDPKKYPAFADNSSFDIQIWLENPLGGKRDDVYSEVYYNVRTDLYIEIKITDESFIEKPDFTIKQELVSSVSEFNELTIKDLEIASTRTEYVSKKLKTTQDEAKHIIQTKLLTAKYNCNEEIAYALLNNNLTRTYKDILFTKAEKLIEEVNAANERNIINFIEIDENTIENEITNLRNSLISAYIDEPEVSTKFSLTGVTEASQKTAIVESMIIWKNDELSQSEGYPLNKFLYNKGVITEQQYNKTVVYDTVAQVSINNIDLSEAILSDVNLNWTSIDDIIAGQSGFETKITELLNHLDGEGKPDPLITLPEGIEDATSYAKYMVKQLEKEYPSQFLKHEIRKTGATLFATTNIPTLLSLNPDFQFGVNHAWATMADPNLNLGEMSDEDKLQLRKDLLAAEQIFQLTPEPNKSVLAEAMMSNNFTSASNIASKTKTGFVQQMLDSLPEGNEVSEVDLERTYALASFVSNAATLEAIRIGAGYNQTGTPVTPQYSFDSTDTSGGLPSLYELFGSQDYFEYPACRTIFSQAAYLTDLLHFLKTCNPTKLDALLTRRPDLQYILLNCSNSNNVLPQIDLVNEILERDVISLNGGGEIDMKEFQTTWKTEELAAYPENQALTKDAYNYLKNAIAPWSLPFNLPLEEFRLYLKTLGLSREEIIGCFSPQTITEDSPKTNENLFESLGLTLNEVNESTGYITNPLSDPEDLNLFYPGISEDEGTGNVKGLMELTRLSYENFQQLLESYFINPANFYGHRYFLYTIPGLLAEDIPEHVSNNVIKPGTLDSTYIMNEDTATDPQSEFDPIPQPSPGNAFYDRLHRFERLRRKLGLEVYQLDLILNYLDCSTLNQTDILRIAYFFKVKSKFNLKLEETLLLFGDFITGKTYSGYVNLYEFIFLKKSENYPLRSLFEALIQGDTPLNNDFVFGQLQTILPFISGIKITEQQYNTIVSKQGYALNAQPDLEQLSLIIRIAYICRSLSISVEEFYFLKEISGLVDNGGYPVADFYNFITHVERIKSYGFSISDLAYILQDSNIEGNTVYKAEKDISAGLSELREIIKPVDKKIYRKHLLTSCAVYFDECIEQALDYVFDEIVQENVSAATDFISDHIDLFNNFSELYTDEQSNEVSLLNYFISNKADSAKKLRAVLVGLGIEQDLTSSPKRKITRAILKNNFLKIKTNILLQIIEMEPLSVKFDERFDLNHTAVSVQDIIIDINIEPESIPYTQTSGTSHSGEGINTNIRSGLSGYKYSATNKQTTLTNSASAGISIGFAESLTVSYFIAHNPGAFPAETGFLTNEQAEDYSTDIDTRYANYVSTMELGVLESKIVELKDLMQLYIAHEYMDDSIKIIAEPQNNDISAEARKEIIEDHFSSFIPRTEALNCLWDTESDDYIVNACLRVDFVLDYLKQESRVDSIVSFFSQRFSCDEEAVVKLLFDYTGASLDSPAIDSFCNKLFFNNPSFSTSVVYPQLSRLYKLIYKSSLIINKFKISCTMLDKIWTITEEADNYFNILNIFNISDDPNTDLQHYLNFSTAIGLSHTYFADETDIFTFFTDNPDVASLSADAKGFISDITGCKTDDLDTLTAVLPDDLYINWFNALLQCRHIIRHLGAKAQTVIDLNKTDTAIGFEESEMIRQLVKNKYSEDEWLAIAASLRNPLREKQRDALRDYLIMKSPDYAYTNDLYYHFLIDTEVTTAVKTTRIAQAILSVQLFIQRVLMGFEGNLGFNDDEKAELVWRKNYRVWEANRKILFFPENWLDPDLRFDKSPFYKELEEKLLQNDIDDTTVLEAYHEYLEKLEEVSNLEILAAHRVFTTANDYSSQKIHLLGRTQGAPYKYFYRKLEYPSSWSPWEEVTNGIKADMVRLVYWNNNLYMFWPEVYVTNKIPENSKANIAWYFTNIINSENYVKEFTAIRLYWSMLKNGKWTKAVMSEDVYVEPVSFYAKTQNISVNVKSNNDSQIEINLGFTLKTECHVYSRGNFIFNGISIRFEYYQPTEPFNPIVPNNIHDYDSKYYWGNLNPFFIRFMFPYVNLNIINNRIFPDVNYTFNLLFARSQIINSDPIGPLPQIPLFTNLESIVIGYDNLHYPEWDGRILGNYYEWFKPIVLTDKKNNIGFIAIPKLTLSNAQSHVYLNDGDSLTYEVIQTYHTYFSKIKEKFDLYGLEKGLFGNELRNNGSEVLKINEDTFGGYYGVDNSRIPNVTNITGNKLKCELTFSNNNNNITDPYTLYNWELFYHIPMLIANNLSANMKFEEAQKWYHFIFNPTIGGNESAPKKYWRIKAFSEQFGESGQLNTPENVSDFVNDLNKNSTLSAFIGKWEDNPFNPHLVAQTRPVAYMKYVITKYIENLLSWGDMLFTKDTAEDINQAVLLYILAADILGIKPQKLEGTLPNAQTYNDLAADNGLDALSNSMETISGILTVVANLNQVSTEQTASFGATSYKVSYFGVPHNSKLEGYWDVVADRLFKIRNSMNIQGVVRELPVTAPPIDPGSVVAAMAAGADLSSALSTLSAPMPLYRFNYMLQKAVEFTNDVKALGNTLLSVLEKRDAESMAMLRSSQEQIMLNAMTQIRNKSIEEANENIASIEKSKDNLTARQTYYASKSFMNNYEIIAMALSGKLAILSSISSSLRSAAAVAEAIPQAHVGVAAAAEYGGKNISGALMGIASSIDVNSSLIQFNSGVINTLGSYKQRKDDWDFQATQASGELLQLDKQMAAANVRLAMAQKELENHLLQIDQKKEEYQFLKDKFTNKELYNWMKGEVSKLYQSAFQMAHKLALAAEKAYVFERQKDGYSSFITSAYWDNLYEGLMAGELLYNDLRRLEMDYIESNAREMELSKDIPLSMIDPQALINLQTNGSCTFDIPEMIYDIDHLGHYMRRIKAVSVSIPAVTGPYNGVSCKLSLTSNRFRKLTSLSSGYAYTGIEDSRFVQNLVGIQSIATSTGNNDTGMFEFNFRDERYLPFEGAGAIGSWSLELPTAIRKFDYESISDVILHIKFTARDAGGTLKSAAEGNIVSALNALMDELVDSEAVLMIAHSLKSEFADELYELLNNTSCTFKIEKKHIPFLVTDYVKRTHTLVNSREIKIKEVELISNNDFPNDLGSSLPEFSNSKWTFTNGETLTDTGISLDLSYDSGSFSGDGDIYMLIKYFIDPLEE